MFKPTDEVHATLEAIDRFIIRNGSSKRDQLYKRLAAVSDCPDAPATDALLCAAAVVEAIDRFGLILALDAKQQPNRQGPTPN